MSRQIPRWAIRLGFSGFFVFAAYLGMKFVVESIFESEVQLWWSIVAKPWLASKVTVEIELFGWQIILGILITVLSIKYWRTRDRSPLGQFRRGKPPVYLNTAGLSTTDIVSAVVSTRKGIMAPSDLATLVVSALNSSLINKETAQSTLGEFGYQLIYLGDERYTSTKLGGNDDENP